MAIFSQILFVSGLSGAGKSTALKILEDLGFEVIDNLPLRLLPLYLEQPLPQKLAIGIDIRTLLRSPQGEALGAGSTTGSTQEVLTAMTHIKEVFPATTVQLLFLDASDEALLRRYEETRRRHPLGHLSLPESLERERLLMALIKDRADVVVDTSRASLPSLIQRLHSLFAPKEGEEGRDTLLAFQVLSFSYRWGVPREADFVFDARFLVNPYYEPALRSLTGEAPDVQAFLEKDKQLPPAFGAIQELLQAALQGFSASNRSYVTLAFGCTGGQHRSVFMAEKTGAWLRQQYRRVLVHHREL